jgi:hypothetical protein
MTLRQPPPDSPVKDAASAPDDDIQTPMGRFRRLARGLLNVSRGDFKREEEKYNAANAARKNNRKAP